MQRTQVVGVGGHCEIERWGCGSNEEGGDRKATRLRPEWKVTRFRRLRVALCSLHSSLSPTPPSPLDPFLKYQYHPSLNYTYYKN